MKHETSTALYSYWLNRHRDAPVRAKGISPTDLAPLLPSLFLIEIAAQGAPAFRFRFCGASIAARYGRDLTDEDYLGLWDGDDRAMLARDLRALAFRSTGLVAGVLAETMSGGTIAYEMLLLPLAGDDSTAGAIGSMVRTGGHDETNRLRARILSQSLRSTRFLPPPGASVFSARDQRPFLPSAELGMQRRYGHLTVVSGGK